MAIFKRETKTRIWGASGDVGFKKFIAYKKEKGLKISLIDENGKIHSITIYERDIKLLKHCINEKQVGEEW